MNDSQAWTLIGGFIALIGVFSTIMFTMLAVNNRSLKIHIDGKFEAVTTRLDATNERLDRQGKRLDEQGMQFDGHGKQLAEMDIRLARLDAHFVDVDHRFTNLEEDMRLVKGHLIGQQSA